MSLFSEYPKYDNCLWKRSLWQNIMSDSTIPIQEKESAVDKITSSINNCLRSMRYGQFDSAGKEKKFEFSIYSDPKNGGMCLQDVSSLFPFFKKAMEECFGCKCELMEEEARSEPYWSRGVFLDRNYLIRVIKIDLSTPKNPHFSPES